MSAVVEQLTGATDADGSFALSGLPLHTLFLGVSAQHLVPKLVRVAPQSLAGERPLTVQLAEGWIATVEIDGLESVVPKLRVRTMPATGSALANNEFAWRAHTQRSWPLEDALPLQIEGLALGERYYVQLEEALPGGKWRAGAAVLLVSESAPRGELSYQPRASVKISARSAQDGTPVEGFDALVERSGFEWDRLTPAPVTSPLPAGTSSYPVKPGEPFRLCIQAAGLASTTLDRVVCAAGELLVIPTVQLQPAGVVSVQVRDAQTGQVLERATLRVREDWTQEPAVWRRNVRTDASGAAQITLGLRHDAELHVSYKGYQSRTLAKLSSASRLTIELQPACSATVHVVDDRGSPVEGIVVSCKPAEDDGVIQLTRESDLERRMTFIGLPAGEHHFAVVDSELIGKRMMMGGSIAAVSISKVHAGQDPVVADVQVGAPAAVQLVVPARVSLAGRVLDGATPQPGVGLHWIDRAVGLDVVLAFTMLGEARFLTDAEGRF